MLLFDRLHNNGQNATLGCRALLVVPTNGPLYGGMSFITAGALFLGGAVMVVVATERLLDGLVGVARAAHVAPFLASVILSGLEAENIAVGVAAGGSGQSDIALGTIYGGAIFLVCAALGLGALIAPLKVDLPRPALAVLVAAAVLSGLPLIGASTPRLAGVILLLAFAAAIVVLARASRAHHFIESEEFSEAGEREPRLLRSVGLTLLGVVLIAIGGELVALGAGQLVDTLGVPAALMGMVVTPAVIEAEEVARQAIPALRGYADVSAGNLIGTVMYFALFNAGVITLLTPVSVPPMVRTLDWPFLVLSTVIAAAFLARGRLGRIAGSVLLALYIVYAVLHVALR